MWRKCLALRSGFALGKYFIILVKSLVQTLASIPLDVFFSSDELDLPLIFSMWIRGCKKQMISLKVKPCAERRRRVGALLEGARALVWLILWVSVYYAIIS